MSTQVFVLFSSSSFNVLFVTRELERRSVQSVLRLQRALQQLQEVMRRSMRALHFILFLFFMAFELWLLSIFYVRADSCEVAGNSKFMEALRRPWIHE